MALYRKKKIADTDIKEGINNALEGNLRKKGRYKNKLEMATHSRILAWRIPWPEEPEGLLSMGSQRDGHDKAT